VLALSAFAGCLTAPVAYPDRSGPWPGNHKQTVKAAEAAVRDAMRGAKLVPAPGNDQAVTVAEGEGEAAQTCINSASFTVAGKQEDMAGDYFQYAWHVCLNDDQTYQLQIACLRVQRNATSTDLVECGGGKVAGAVARRSDEIVDKLRQASR
jgi:hypothetical protein